MKTNKELRDTYSQCYANDGYRMGHPRKQKMLAAVQDAINDFRRSPEHMVRGLTMADVGCGRGELLQEARELDHFRYTVGFEIVPELCGSFGSWKDNVWNGYEVARIESIGKFPRQQNKRTAFGEFDIVTCSDVLEHILPEETESALQALWDMTSGTLILHVAWFSHRWCMPDGTSKELHINLRNAAEWSALVEKITGKRPAVDADSTTALLVVSR